MTHKNELNTAIISPFNLDEICELKSTMKNQHYIFERYCTEQKEYIMNILKMIDIEQLGNINTMYDFSNNSKCSNVISITLYIINAETRGYFSYTYFNCIKRTIQNVKKCLPNWIVRLYFDDSVYDYYEKITHNFDDNDINIITSIKNTWKYIIESDIVEIYTLKCPIHDKNKMNNLYKNRTLRFLPLCDSNVNICIFREADGIVSKLDCHNINMFTKSNSLFYLPLSMYFDNSKNKYTHYSKWLNNYCNMYHNGKITKYDLLAGAFGTKIKIKKDYFYKSLYSY
jgi:hypothetical protein